MSTTIYRDSEANAIFIEDANGAQFLNSLHATVDTDLVSITDTAKNFDLVSGLDHTEIIDQNGVLYGATATEACDALNVIFTTAGSTGEVPVITSNTTINVTEGDTINYELTADYGVGYEWDSLPSGVVTVDGNIRKLIGGSSLTAGTYTPTVKAINYFGEDSETITINVANAPFANTKSVDFQNQDWLQGDATTLSPVFSRTGNGSGASDAWTISMYYKASGNQQGQTIFYYGGDNTTNEGHITLTQVNVSGGAKQLRLRYGHNFNRIQLQSAGLTAGVWQHILVSYDGGTTGSDSNLINDYYGRFKIYIDGALTSPSTSNNNFGYSDDIDADRFRIGRYNNGNYMRNCRVDELAVWSSDQSSNISDIYNSGSPFDLSSLSTQPTHWWRMGDGDTFPTLQDNIGNADFTMQNMTVADIVNDVP